MPRISFALLKSLVTAARVVVIVALLSIGDRYAESLQRA